jgi:hypothetical protein
MPKNNWVKTLFNKPFDNFSEDDRKITMTHDLTKIANHISIEVRLANT